MTPMRKLRAGRKLLQVSTIVELRRYATVLVPEEGRGTCSGKGAFIFLVFLLVSNLNFAPLFQPIKNKKCTINLLNFELFNR